MILSTSSSRAVSIRIGHVGGLADPAAELDSVAVGQVEVEDDQRGWLARELDQCVLRGRCGAHAVSGIPQIRGHEGGDRRLVLDDQDRVLLLAHRCVRPPSPGRCTQGEALGLVGKGGAQRALDVAVDAVLERVHPDVLARQTRIGIERNDASADRRHRDAGASDDDPVAAADHAEPEPLAAVEDGLRPEPFLRHLAPDHERRVAIPRRVVGHPERPGRQTPENGALQVEHDHALPVLDREHADVPRRRAGGTADERGGDDRAGKEDGLPHDAKPSIGIRRESSIKTL